MNKAPSAAGLQDSRRFLTVTFRRVPCPPCFLLKLEGRHRQSGALVLGLAPSAPGVLPPVRLLTAGSPAALNNLCGVLRTVALIPVNGLAQTTAPFVGVFTSERDSGSLRQIESQALRRRSGSP